MKRKNWPVEKITSILQEAEAGMPVAYLCRKYGMSDVTYCNWKKKYGGMTVDHINRGTIWGASTNMGLRDYLVHPESTLFSGPLSMGGGGLMFRK